MHCIAFHCRSTLESRSCKDDGLVPLRRCRTKGLGNNFQAELKTRRHRSARRRLLFRQQPWSSHLFYTRLNSSHTFQEHSLGHISSRDQDQQRPSTNENLLATPLERHRLTPKPISSLGYQRRLITSETRSTPTPQQNSTSETQQHRYHYGWACRVAQRSSTRSPTPQACVWSVHHDHHSQTRRL